MLCVGMRFFLGFSLVRLFIFSCVLRDLVSGAGCEGGPGNQKSCSRSRRRCLSVQVLRIHTKVFTLGTFSSK